MGRADSRDHSSLADFGLGGVLALAALVTGLPGLTEIGVTWDEPYYFTSVERIQSWASELSSPEWRRALSEASLQSAWNADRLHNPHPPFYKISMAATNSMFDTMLGVPASYRLSSLVMFCILVLFVAAGTGRVAGLLAGLGAGLSLLLVPRVFGHAHIGATDMPLTFLWFASTASYFLYVRDGGRRWLVAGGIAFGLGLATKFTALLLPLPLIAWMLLKARNVRSRRVLTYGTGLAVIVAVIVNPGAWPDPGGYQAQFIHDSLSRAGVVPISTHYGGTTFDFEVPWEHATVMTLITVPIAILALAILGAVHTFREDRLNSVGVLSLAQVAFWLTLMALPASPNHDGVRLWLPMFPFVAVLSGFGFGVLATAVRQRVSSSEFVVVGLLSAVYFGPALVTTVQTAPLYLAYYGEMIGGVRGAADRGMETTYWFDAVTATFRHRLNTTLPDSARVLAHPEHCYYEQLQELGLLREDLAFTGDRPADYALLVARRAMFDAAWHEVYRTTEPVAAVTLDDVVLVALYEPPPRLGVSTCN